MRLLEQNRYLDRTIPKIAKKANASPANIYRSHSSKFELFYDVPDPWLSAKSNAFADQAFDVSDPKERFELTFRFIWIDLPEADNCFLLNLIEALASNERKTDTHGIFCRRWNAESRRFWYPASRKARPRTRAWRMRPI